MACVAAVMHMCPGSQPPHPTFEATCGLCLAARSGYCESHGRGALKALEEFASSLDEEHAAHFAPWRTAIEWELTKIPEDKHVSIEAHAYEGLEDMTPRGAHISIVQARE